MTTATAAELKKKRWLGLFALIGLAVFNVGQAEIAQRLQVDAKFTQTLFIVYANHSWNILVMPFTWLWYLRNRRRQRARVHDQGEGEGEGDVDKDGTTEHKALITEPPSDGLGENESLLTSSVANPNPLSTKGEDGFFNQFAYAGWPVRRLLKHALWMTILYFASDVAWYLGLPLVIVSVALAVFNCTCVFTFIFEIIFLSHKPNLQKIIPLTLTVTGVILVVLFPSTSSSSTQPASTSKQVFGGLVVVCCACGYALYEVLTTKYVFTSPASSSTSFANFISCFQAGINLLIAWVFIWVAHMTGVEEFKMPNHHQFSYLVATGFAAVGFNLLFMLSIALTSPFHTSVALVASIPLSALTDYVIHRIHATTLGYVGSGLILLSFALMHYLQPLYDPNKSSHPPSDNDSGPLEDSIHHRKPKFGFFWWMKNRREGNEDNDGDGGIWVKGKRKYSTMLPKKGAKLMLIPEGNESEPSARQSRASHSISQSYRGAIINAIGSGGSLAKKDSDIGGIGGIGGGPVDNVNGLRDRHESGTEKAHEDSQ